MKNTKVNLDKNKRLSQLFSIGLTLGILSAANVRAEEAQNNVYEIGWTSRLTSMGIDTIENMGKTYKFKCQEAAKGMYHAPVWGTQVYTTESGICSTAVHAGMISEEGGYVTVKLIQGQEFYTGSDKNDVQSEDYAATDLSYVFVGEPIIVNGQPVPKPTRVAQQKPKGIEQVVVNTVQKGVERTIEQAIINIFK